MTNAERRWEEATLNRLTDNLTKVFRLVIGTLYNNLKQKISIQRSGYSPALDGRASSLR